MGRILRTAVQSDPLGGIIADDSGRLGPATQGLPRSEESGSGWLLGARYRVIDRIGTGGMAEVFRAHDELLARDVAVKVFRRLPDTPSGETGAKRQQIELHALARLNHPNLTTLFDGSIVGTDGPAYLVMELIDGPSLAARIAERPLTEAESRELGVQIADALAYVHAEGMVHRDVKPANILLGTDHTGDDTARARLSDFGIVRLLDSERMTSVDFTLGTASYLAPEQARGMDVGPVADVYSLGLVLIETLTGVRCFDGPALDALMARLTRDPEIPTQLPAPWPDLLTAMTGSDPAKRPTASQVAQSLRDARGARPVPLLDAAGAAGALGTADLAATDTVSLHAVSTPVENPWSTVDEPRRRRGAGVLLAAAGLVAALAAGGWLLFHPTASHAPPAGGSVVTTPHKTSPILADTRGNQTVPVKGSTTGSRATSKTTHRGPVTAGPTTNAPTGTTPSNAPGTATSSAAAGSSSAPSPSPTGSTP